MHRATTKLSPMILATALLLGLALPTLARAADHDRHMRVGFVVSIGGRFDNVRLCPATPLGSKGGPTLDLAAVVDVPLETQATMRITVPVLRPILFGLAFRMLQFEPYVAILFHRRLDDWAPENGDYTSWTQAIGPVFGISLHHGPDTTATIAGEGRGPSFFAVGPLLGASIIHSRQVIDLWHATGFGVTPYITPLFGADVPDPHRGIAIGGHFDLSLYARWD